MRLWMDERNRVLTDEQLLRQIAYHGSLKDSLDHGNVRLISSSGEWKPAPRREGCPQKRSLADYLED